MVKGGEGASELAQQVIDAAEEPNTFTYLYETDTPIRTRVEKIATEIYGAGGVDWSREAQEKLNRFEADSDNAALGICMVKTHLSSLMIQRLKALQRDGGCLFKTSQSIAERASLFRWRAISNLCQAPAPIQDFVALMSIPIREK